MKKIFSYSFLMYPKSRNDLMWSCCGEDKRARCKKPCFVKGKPWITDSTK